MANLLTKKVMENMSRQYRKDHCNGFSSTDRQESRRNINSSEEALILGLIRNQKESVNHKNFTGQGQRLNLDDLAGYRDKGEQRNSSMLNKISLDELAQKQK